MAIPQRKFREIVLQLMYSFDLSSPQETVIPLMMKELSASKKEVTEAYDRANTVLTRKDSLDQLISENSSSYPLDRIHVTEKNILRLGIYELLYDEEIPAKVAIAEAMRLAKKFASPEATQYVNAVVDAVYKKQSNEETEH